MEIEFRGFELNNASFEYLITSGSFLYLLWLHPPNISLSAIRRNRNVFVVFGSIPYSVAEKIWEFLTMWVYHCWAFYDNGVLKKFFLNRCLLKKICQFNFKLNLVTCARLECMLLLWPVVMTNTPHNSGRMILILKKSMLEHDMLWHADTQRLDKSQQQCSWHICTCA